MTHSNTFKMLEAKTIWLTGLSGAGKSTLAHYLKQIHFSDYVIIDGDELRNGVCKDLGFTNADREQNIIRAAHICQLLNKQGVKVIACMMSPLEEQRKMVREIISPFGFFVYVSCGIDELRRRDTKGLYAKFDQGLIQNMSGLDLPFDVPENPDAVVNTQFMSLELCAKSIISSHYLWGNKKHNDVINSFKL
jgi:adenylyl-sulfate kinase